MGQEVGGVTPTPDGAILCSVEEAQEFIWTSSSWQLTLMDIFKLCGDTQPIICASVPLKTSSERRGERGGASELFPSGGRCFHVPNRFLLCVCHHMVSCQTSQSSRDAFFYMKIQTRLELCLEEIPECTAGRETKAQL